MFTQEQLEHIKYNARHVKNQGEMAVYRVMRDVAIATNTLTIFSGTQWRLIEYCAEECKRQHSGEMSVYDMVNAWNWATEWYNVPTPAGPISIYTIEHIGYLVEPIDNAKGFRTIPIGVTDGMGGWIEKAAYYDIPRKLEFLLAAYYEGFLGAQTLENGITAVPNKGPNRVGAPKPEDEFYFEYEEIHPFRDGNGRSGKILYNYLLGTLDNPVMPPNFWGGTNP